SNVVVGQRLMGALLAIAVGILMTPFMMAQAPTAPAAMTPTSRTRTMAWKTRRRKRLRWARASSANVARSSGPVTTWCPCNCVTSLGRLRCLAIDHQHACVDGRPLVQRGADCPMDPIFEVQQALVLDHVREQIPKKR